MKRDVRGGRRAAILGAALVAFAVTALSGAPAARAQTGGISGTTTTAGPLGDADIFIGVQKIVGVNLSDVDKARFLNHASCQCHRPVWIKAIINASSAVKAQTLPGTNIVTMKVGQSCNQMFYYGSCPTLQTIPLSEFRLTGMLVETTVDLLAKPYGTAVNTVGTTILGSGGDTGTGSGGSSGSGGDSGSGGSSGSGGATGEATTATDPCAVGDAFSQPVWIFVESTAGLLDNGGTSLNIVIDGSAPPPPSPVTVAGVNEALSVGWVSVNNDNSVPDLQGYQVFCSRADQYQVFNDGTFSTSVDSCPATDGIIPADAGTDTQPTFPSDLDPMALINGNTHYICSDLLSASTTSHRVEILQNAIPYGIAVASVDIHGNASLAFPSPVYTAPVPTLDFYHEYRAGDPMGNATGGCAVAGHASGFETLSSLTVIATVLNLVRKRRRGRRS